MIRLNVQKDEQLTALWKQHECFYEVASTGWRRRESGGKKLLQRFINSNCVHYTMQIFNLFL